MSDHYQYVNVSSVREDSAAIIDVLKRIQKKEIPNDLRLLNYYEEIPVNYPARIDYIEDDMVGLETHQHQAVVMKIEKKTIIKSSHFPHEVLANVFRSDIQKSLALVTNFAYVQVKAERRRYVRVRVKGDHDVIFTNGDTKIRGKVFDISLSGLAMVTQEPSDIDTQSDGTLLLSLGDKPVSMEAKLIKKMDSVNDKRFVFDFSLLSKDEAILSQFIFQRQVEIIKELKDSII